jgi:hypothetical protein
MPWCILASELPFMYGKFKSYSSWHALVWGEKGTLRLVRDALGKNGLKVFAKFKVSCVQFNAIHIYEI